MVGVRVVFWVRWIRLAGPVGYVLCGAVREQ